MEELGASLTGEGLGFFDGKFGNEFSKSKRSYRFKMVGSKWQRGFSVTFSPLSQLPFRRLSRILETRNHSMNA